jgi:ABC-type transporter Mla subunit MlaD
MPLVAGDSEYPLIPARNVGLAALLSDGPEITRKISELLDKANQLLDQAGPDLVATMQALNQTSDNLVNMSERMDSWLTDHDRDMRQFMDGGLAKAPALIADTRNTMREFDKLLNELRENASQLVYEPKSEAVPVEH